MPYLPHLNLGLGHDSPTSVHDSDFFEDFIFTKSSRKFTVFSV